MERVELPDLDRGVVRTRDQRSNGGNPLNLVDPVSVAVQVRE